MAEAVVDLLEAVEVDPMHGEAGRILKRQLEPLTETEAIADVGERIVASQSRDLLLRRSFL